MTQLARREIMMAARRKMLEAFNARRQRPPAEQATPKIVVHCNGGQ